MRRMRAAIVAGGFASFADDFRARFRDDLAADEAPANAKDGA